jgi:hypothetical protein
MSSSEPPIQILPQKNEQEHVIIGTTYPSEGLLPVGIAHFCQPVVNTRQPKVLK